MVTGKLGQHIVNKNQKTIIIFFNRPVVVGLFHELHWGSLLLNNSSSSFKISNIIFWPQVQLALFQNKNKIIKCLFWLKLHSILVSLTTKFHYVFVSPTTIFHSTLMPQKLNVTPFWCPRQLPIKLVVRNTKIKWTLVIRETEM